MAKDHRLLDPHGTEAAVIEVMKIRAADATGADGDGDLTNSRGLFGTFLDPEVVRGVNNHSLHCLLRSDLRRRHRSRYTTGVGSGAPENGCRIASTRAMAYLVRRRGDMGDDDVAPARSQPGFGFSEDVECRTGDCWAFSASAKLPRRREPQ